MARDCNPVQVRVRIEGTFRGQPWVYEDPEDDPGCQFIHFEDTNPDPSTFWWSEGNFACDCNRASFVPDEILALLPKENDVNNEGEVDCGELICIDRIIPFDPRYPTLELGETQKRAGK